jgi:NAD(P)-dependent dehydrogenase (short-subunit alcohol dehydrogenase family)
MADPRVGVVTGAGRGMGLACARRVAGTVDTLVVVDRDEASLGTVAADLGAQVDVVPMTIDVADRDAVARLGEIAAPGALGPIVHAAGVSPTMAAWRQIFEVDLVGTALVIDALTPLVGPGTAAVCFASMAAHLVVPEGADAADAVLDDPLAPSFLDALASAIGPGIEDPGAAYSWAKRGVQRLVRRVAVGWGRRGARICSVSPGMIDTPQGRQEAAAQPAMAVLLEHTPLGREGESDELAAVVSFLVSDDASFLTGTDVLVDGGVVAAMEALGGFSP